MRLLGAILAGGRSRRFGGDKSVATWGGSTLLDHVAAALVGQCEAIVVAGRDWPDIDRVDDLPTAGLGPLGGLAGALEFARRHGFDAVLTSGCDLPTLPRNIARLLGPPDALLVDQPTVGIWRADLIERLIGHMRVEPRRSIRGWAAAIGARQVSIDPPLANVNTVEDLKRLDGAFMPSEDPRSSP